MKAPIEALNVHLQHRALELGDRVREFRIQAKNTIHDCLEARDRRRLRAHSRASTSSSRVIRDSSSLTTNAPASLS